MNETKLKPCPFCGGKAELKKSKLPDDIAFDGYLYCVVCQCGYKVAMRDSAATRESEEYIIDFWNRRATDEQ
jgi:Lar family restriction alleviation protein